MLDQNATIHMLDQNAPIHEAMKRKYARNTRLQGNEYQGIKMDDYGAFRDVHILTTTRCKLSREECIEPQ